MSPSNWDALQMTDYETDDSQEPWGAPTPSAWQQQRPRVMSADEALGPPTNWQAAAARFQEPQQTKSQRRWAMADSINTHVAHGVAAATGMPAWQRAAASIDRDNEMGMMVDAAERKSRLGQLADLSKQEQAEQSERMKYERDPMSEYEGVTAPLSMTSRMAQQDALAHVRGEEQEQQSAWQRQRQENADRTFDANEMERRRDNVSTENYRDRMSAQGAERIAQGAKRIEMSKEESAWKRANPGRGGEPEGPPPRGRTDVRAATAMALDQLWEEGVKTPTPEQIDARVEQILVMQDRHVGMTGVAGAPPGFDDLMADDSGDEMMGGSFDPSEYEAWLSGAQ